MTTYPLQINLKIPDNDTFQKGIDNILIRGNVTDDCGGVEGATVQYYIPERDVFCAPIEEEIGANQGYYNCTISNTTQGNWPLGFYNITMNATKQYYNNSEN